MKEAAQSSADCTHSFSQYTVGYLGGVACSGSTVLLEDSFQLGQSCGADVWTDAIIVLNQDLLLLTLYTTTCISPLETERY